MGSVLSIALGGALGALARHAIITLLPMPYGTLAVNVVGSFVIGVCYIALPEAWRPLVMVGALGALTTFSTFSLDSLRLVEEGAIAHATLYVLGSVVLSLGAVWFGVFAARSFAL